MMATAQDVKDITEVTTEEAAHALTMGDVP